MRQHLPLLASNNILNRKPNRIFPSMMLLDVRLMTEFADCIAEQLDVFSINSHRDEVEDGRWLQEEGALAKAAEALEAELGEQGGEVAALRLSAETAEKEAARLRQAAACHSNNCAPQIAQDQPAATVGLASAAA